MKEICKKYGDNLTIKEDKLSLDTEQDIDVILKALGDYYKKEKFQANHMELLQEKNSKLKMQTISNRKVYY